MNIITLMCLIVCVSVGNGKDPKQLVGGSTVEIEDFPYQVSIRSKGYHICGGSIISDSHILTAASCVSRAIDVFLARLDVLTGTNDKDNIHEYGVIHAVRYTIFHEEYDPQNFWFNDIAILKLTTPIFLSVTRAVIPLSARSTRVGSGAWVSGWGGKTSSLQISTRYLQKLFLRILPHERCISMFQSFGEIKSNQNCASMPTLQSAISRGDSGNPVVTNNVIIGIVSFSVPGNIAYPFVYTSVKDFRDWIRQVMDNY